jgi:uncharacterized protein (DUF924 family)
MRDARLLLGGAMLGAAALALARRRLLDLSEIKSVLDFWFTGQASELYASRWFVQEGSAAQSRLDELIRERFSELLSRAEQGRLNHWAREVRGTLALILLLDQFSRHAHRSNAPVIGANDARALALAQSLLSRGLQSELKAEELVFALMPLRHSPTVARLQQVGELSMPKARGGLPVSRNVCNPPRAS